MNLIRDSAQTTALEKVHGGLSLPDVRKRTGGPKSKVSERRDSQSSLGFLAQWSVEGIQVSPRRITRSSHGLRACA